MKEVTISVKTTFRLIKELSGLPSTDERVGLVNLLSREALGDIKAEEQHYPLRKDVDNLKKIWDAMGMSLSGNPTLDKILNIIDNDRAKANDRQKNLSERFDLLEALRSQLSVQQWDQMSGALANLKQNYVEAERDLKKEQESNKYLRASLKDIEQALVLPPGYTAAYLVEKIAICTKSHEILAQVEAFLTNSSSLYPAHYSAASHMERWHMASELLFVIKGKAAVCAPAQKVSWCSTAQKAAESASDPVLHFQAKVSELEAKLTIANRKLSDINDVLHKDTSRILKLSLIEEVLK